MGKTVQRNQTWNLRHAKYHLAEIWIWQQTKVRCTLKMVEPSVRARALERIHIALSLSIYASFYLHARIWHPIVNNKVISLFATLSLSFVRFTIVAVICAVFFSALLRCQAHLFCVFDYCCSPFYLRSGRVVSQLQMHFFCYAVSHFSRQWTTAIKNCARPCDVGLCCCFFFIRFMPIFSVGVKSLFGFMFDSRLPSLSAPWLICSVCDIMPSLLLQNALLQCLFFFFI